MTNKDILIIKQSSFGVNCIMDYGYSVCRPYISNNRLLNFIRNVWNKFNLPYKDIWYNKKLIGIKEKYIIVIDSLITQDFIKWLKKYNKDKRIIFTYLNIVSMSLHPDLIREYCSLYTWDKNDADRYGLNYFKGGYYFQNVTPEKKRFDIMFIGRDKGRLQTLLELKKTFEDKGLSTFFYIVGDRGFSKSNNGFNYQKEISYEETLKLSCQSRAILDIVQDGQCGVTFRVYESMFYNIKLITNNHSIKKMDIYNSHNIFLLGKDDINNINVFLESDYELVPTSVSEQYTFKYYVENTINELEKKSE